MTQEEYRASAEDVVYLAACMVNGNKPDAERVRRMDLELLYKAANWHLLTAVTAYALEAAGVRDEAFTQAKSKAIRKNILLDTERARVLGALDEAGIWYMPLKGSVLKELYPALGMRQMADNDILFDADRAKEVRAVMETLGFRAEHFGIGIHDCYYKEPVYNFEMHRALFGEVHEEALRDYYRDMKGRLLKDKGNACGWHFSDEDFYIYMIAHEYKHYSKSGTGLRSLLDAYVYVSKKGEALNWSYIAGELEKLDITDFEAQNRSLALHLFDGEALTETETEMLEYVLSSGTYGTFENYARNQIATKGRCGYFLSRLFPPLYKMKMLYPILRPLPILLPICWLMRLVTAVITKPQKVWYQLKMTFIK